MIEKLNKLYDEEIFDCISQRGGPGGWWNSNGFLLSSPLIKLAEKFVFYCCDTLNRNKNTHITADFECDMFDPASFSTWVCFSIDCPENCNQTYKDKIVPKSDRLIKFEMPKFSSDFNRDPLIFYKELITKIYDKYKSIIIAIKDITVRQGVQNKLHNSTSTYFNNSNFGIPITNNINNTVAIYTKAEIDKMVSNGARLLKISDNMWYNETKGDIYVEYD